MDRGAWWITVHGVAESQTQLGTHTLKSIHSWERTRAHTHTHTSIHSITLVQIIADVCGANPRVNS